MRIAVLSDIHGNLAAFKAVIRDLRKRKITQVIFLGDLVLKGPQPRECFEKLNHLRPMVWIQGNTDRWLAIQEVVDVSKDASNAGKALYAEYAMKQMSSSEIQAILNRPVQESILVQSTSLLAVHGSPQSPTDIMGDEIALEKMRKYLENTREQWVLSGHSHNPSQMQVNDQTVVNVGSVGMPYDGDVRASYGLLTVKGKKASIEIIRVPYSIERTIKVAYDNAYPEAKKYEQQLRKAKST